MLLVLSIIIVVETLAIIFLLWHLDWAPYDGFMNIYPEEDGKQTFSLELKSDPMKLKHKQQVRFKVQELRD